MILQMNQLFHLKVSNIVHDSSYYHRCEQEKYLFKLSNAFCYKNGFIFEIYLTNLVYILL